MLGREHHGFDADGLVVLVAQRHLALGIRAQPGKPALLAHLGLFLHQAVRERDRRGHQHIRLVRGVAEHQALVAGALLALVLAIHALRDIRRLLADDVDDAAARAVEAHLGGVVADVEHGLASPAPRCRPRRWWSPRRRRWPRPSSRASRKLRARADPAPASHRARHRRSGRRPCPDGLRKPTRK